MTQHHKENMLTRDRFTNSRFSAQHRPRPASWALPGLVAARKVFTLLLMVAWVALVGCAKSNPPAGTAYTLAPSLPPLATVEAMTATSTTTLSPPQSATGGMQMTPSLVSSAGPTYPSPASTSTPVTLQSTPAWRPTYAPSDAELQALIDAMTLQDKVAQMLIVGFHGQSIASSPELATLVGVYHVGGVVLLEANAHDPQQLRSLTTELQSLALSSGANIPLFISINHEGGIVVRITQGVTGFPGNMAVAATGQPAYAYTSAALAAQELRALGVNMNLAPVLDVNDNPLNPVIGARSFGESAALTAEYGRLAVRGSQENGVIAVAKHFPGHGSVAVDSHGGLPVLQASAEELTQRELAPFKAAVAEGVAAIMTAHIVAPALDASGRPATLSARILTELLRQEMGYEGLIMTDSLGMGAITATWGQAQAAVEAVQAGADILLSTSPMDAHIAIIQALVAAVQRGNISIERLDTSVRRILRAKYAYDLFAPGAVDLSGVGAPEHQAVADEIARQSVTLLRDDAAAIPLPPPPAKLLLISPQQLPPAASGNGTLFAELLRQRGYEVTEWVLNLDSGESRNLVYANALAQAPAHDVVIFGEWELIKRYVNLGDQWQEQFIGVLQQANPALIVVAWHNPAALLRCPQVATFLTAYGETSAQVAAIVAVLSGAQPPLGHLPITLPEPASGE